jgi:DNA polymerase III delta subunit
MKSSAGRSKAGSAGAGESPPASRSARARPASVEPRRAPAPVGLRGVLEAFDGATFPSSLYLEGPSEPTKAALLAELHAAWAAACPESPRANVLRAAETGVDEILAAYQSASLFSPRELVIVLDIEDLGRSEKRVEALANGIAQATSASTIALVESAADSGRKTLEPLRAACAVRVELYPPGRAELLAWGRRRFRREKLDAEDGVLEALVEACEGDPLAYFSELDKLCVWAARHGRLTRAEVQTLLRPVVGSDLPDYLAAVAAGHAGLATQRLGRLLATGVGEGTVLFSLSNLVGGALGGWARYRDASSALRRRSSPTELGRALDAMYRAEAAWKGGRADVVAVLEQATRTLCGLA